MAAASFKAVMVVNARGKLVEVRASQEEQAAEISHVQQLLEAAGNAAAAIFKEQERAVTAE